MRSRCSFKDISTWLVRSLALPIERQLRKLRRALFLDQTRTLMSSLGMPWSAKSSQRPDHSGLETLSSLHQFSLKQKLPNQLLKKTNWICSEMIPRLTPLLPLP